MPDSVSDCNDIGSQLGRWWHAQIALPVFSYSKCFAVVVLPEARVCSLETVCRQVLHVDNVFGEFSKPLLETGMSLDGDAHIANRKERLVQRRKTVSRDVENTRSTAF